MAIKPVTRIDLERARKTADEIIKHLAPYCKKHLDGQTPHILTVGSVRRRHTWVHDIDIVLIASDYWNLVNELKRLGRIISGGSKIIHLEVGAIPVDIYLASEETWATLVLIRTGSTQSNIKLCSIAKERGWHLAADGSGLFNEKKERIAGETEQSIYHALGLVYKEPWERG
jgi:DNA polymerase (family 10)